MRSRVRRMQVCRVGARQHRGWALKQWGLDGGSRPETCEGRGWDYEDLGVVPCGRGYQGEL